MHWHRSRFVVPASYTKLRMDVVWFSTCEWWVVDIPHVKGGWQSMSDVVFSATHVAEKSARGKRKINIIFVCGWKMHEFLQFFTLRTPGATKFRAHRFSIPYVYDDIINRICIPSAFTSQLVRAHAHSFRISSAVWTEFYCGRELKKRIISKSPSLASALCRCGWRSAKEHSFICNIHIIIQ